MKQKIIHYAQALEYVLTSANKPSRLVASFIPSQRRIKSSSCSILDKDILSSVLVVPTSYFETIHIIYKIHHHCTLFHSFSELFNIFNH